MNYNKLYILLYKCQFNNIPLCIDFIIIYNYITYFFPIRLCIFTYIQDFLKLTILLGIWLNYFFL